MRRFTPTSGTDAHASWSGTRPVAAHASTTHSLSPSFADSWADMQGLFLVTTCHSHTSRCNDDTMTKPSCPQP